MIRQFNATLESAWRGFGLRVAYIGSRGVNMNYSLDINKPAASTTAIHDCPQAVPDLGERLRGPYGRRSGTTIRR